MYHRPIFPLDSQNVEIPRLFLSTTTTTTSEFVIELCGESSAIILCPRIVSLQKEKFEISLGNAAAAAARCVQEQKFLITGNVYTTTFILGLE